MRQLASQLAVFDAHAETWFGRGGPGQRLPFCYDATYTRRTVSLADEYRRQVAWRSWSDVVSTLPAVAGKTVLDLGCAIGDQAAMLAERGAHVIGVDLNEELLAVARSRKIPNAQFRRADLRSLHDVGIVDGIWCSFAAAYVPDLVPVLAAWRRQLTTDGWIALTEVDDLFGHEPIRGETRALLAGYAQEALQDSRYDFHMGRKLCRHLESAGFTILESRTLVDLELSFGGAAAPDVLEAWTLRLDRMKLLREFCGAKFESARADLLRALAHRDHLSSAKVYVCLGRSQVLHLR